MVLIIFVKNACMSTGHLKKINSDQQKTILDKKLIFLRYPELLTHDTYPYFEVKMYLAITSPLSFKILIKYQISGTIVKNDQQTFEQNAQYL
jgi:hypothetical protein